MDRGNHRRRLVAPMLLVGLLATACGDDDDGTDAAATTAASDTAATTASDATTAASDATTAASDAATTAASTVTSVACTGDPVKFMVINNLTGPGGQFPEAAEGAQAAAAAANETCALGRPIEILTCDDQFDPNAAAACGREAVAEGVVADVGSISGFGDAWMPLLAEAGIPAFGNVATSQAETTSPLSFPTVAPIGVVVGSVSAAASIGATKLHIVALDIPAVAFLLDLANKQIAEVGMQEAGTTLVPPDAADMTQYAAQALGSGADAIVVIIGTEQNKQLLRALSQQGADFSELAVISGSVTLGPAAIDDLGEVAENTWLAGPAWPTSDSTNPGIEQYLAELEAIGATAVTSDVGVNAWSSMHHVIDVLEGSATIDSATLAEALVAAGPVETPELAPYDLSAPAFPDDPVLSTLRIFSRDFMITRVVDGEIVPAVENFVDVTEKATLLTL